jgi:hypothetical protein
MSIVAAFLCTTSAAWHGVNAYYFCVKSVPFVRTYRLTDERTESLASDVISWYGGLHAVLSVYAFISAFRVFSLPKVDMQVPMLLGAVGLSQGILVRPDDRWRPELKWITIINSSLAFAHLSLALFLYRRSSSGFIIDIINNFQKFINK